MKKVFSIEYMHNTAERKDYWHGRTTNSSKFYEISKYEFNIERYSESEGVLINYIFKPSKFNILYERSTYNLFVALGQLGGLQSSLFVGGKLFASVFSYKLMMSSLIGRLFHFRAKFKSEIKRKKGSKKL